MSKKLISIILSFIMLISSVGTATFASGDVTVDVTTTVNLTDGCFTRRGSTTEMGEIAQGNSTYVLDSNTANNFRVAFLKFDMSGTSLDEIENASDISLVLNDSQGDALPTGEAYDIKVSVLEESKNAWDSTTLSYAVANANSMYSSGTDVAVKSDALGDTGAEVQISLDKQTLKTLIESSTSKVLTFRVTSNNGVWVFSGGVSGEKSPKLTITSQVSISDEMQIIYDNLDFTDISSDSETSVTNNLDFSCTENLPYGIEVDWSSSSDGVVTADGVVNQPITNYGGTDAAVTLTATIFYPANPSVTPLVHTFDILVPARALTEQEIADNAKIDIVNTLSLSDGCFTRKGGGNSGDGIVPQGNGMYVLDSSTTNNFRVAFLKFDLSNTSLAEIENSSNVKLILNDLQGDALPSNSAYNIKVTALEEAKNNWDSSTLSYSIANGFSMYSDGFDLAEVSGSLADSGESIEIALDKDTLYDVLENSTSKVITLRVQSTNGVWVFSGGVSAERSPKLTITSEVNIANEMQSIYDNLDFNDISSDSETSVTNDLDFSATENLPYGIVAEWSSSSDGVVSQDGTVTRPITNFGGADENVTLRVTISCPDFPELSPLVREFNITVSARSLTDAEFVADEIPEMTFDKIKGSNASADAVVSDLDFSYQGIYDGTTITYSSSPSGYISPEGNVTRPAIGADDATVVITAHIVNGMADDYAQITLVVSALEPTEDLMDSKEIYATCTANISKNNRDTPGSRPEPVIAASGHPRFALLRFDLSSLNDEELSGLDSAMFRMYVTSEVDANNSNFNIGVVPESLEANLEASSAATTYNMLSSYGILDIGAVPTAYASENILQSAQNYETANIIDDIKANLDSASNKVVWILINSTQGIMVLGSPDDPNPIRRPTLKVKHLKAQALRDLEEIVLPQIVTSDIPLPLVGTNGTPIVWSTSDSDVVASDGSITRYNIGENYDLEDTTATLTATTSNLWATYTKDFNIRVKMGGVIDSLEGATVDTVQTDTSSQLLSLGGSNEAKAAILFNLTEADKEMIFGGRKTALKIYGDPSFASIPVKLYAVSETILQSLAGLSSLDYDDIDQIISSDATLIGTSALSDRGYMTFDVSDYVRNIQGSKAAFIFVSSETMFLDSPETTLVKKLPKLIVSDVAFTNAYGAQTAAEAIKISDLTNDPQNALRFDLNLPTSGIYNSSISWSITPSSGAINTITGALNRTDVDQNVTLTATVTVGDQTATKSFDVVVKKSESTQEYLAYVLSGININEKHLTSSITLPGEELLELGFVDAIEWVSSEDHEATVDGFQLRLNRPASADLAVNLTVKVKFNGEWAQKNIGVWVLRSSDANILRNRQVVHGDAAASNAVDENIDTFWQASRKTVVYNLNSKRVISSITIIPYQTAIEGIKISISDDDITYTEVYNGGHFTAEQLGYITFTPVAYGRYLKIELPQNSRGIRFLGAYTTSDESSADVFSGITVPQSATSGFSLASTILGSSVAWTSSSSVITISGSYAIVNRQKNDVNVTLTAKVVIDGVEKTKNYVVKVPGTGADSGSGDSSSSRPSLGGSTTITAPVVVPSVPQTPTKPMFSDLGDASWAGDYITTLASKGILNGYGDGTFAPNAFITREEISKILVVAFGIEKGKNSSLFTDVDTNAWYYGYVDALVSQGHTQGVGNGLFGTGTNITRQDAFTMLASVLGLKYDSTELDTGFYDDGMISPYARLAILALKEHGIIGGDNFGNINPTAGITRAEVAKIICHSLNK